MSNSSKYTNTIWKDRARRAKKFLRSALLVMLCFAITGCQTILGDGEINIVTAPPLVTPRVVVVDSYGSGEASRFDIPGTDAFYLLNGIANHPDDLQDFNCLDYTNDGFFVYYYCAPAYISPEDVNALKGKSGIRESDEYPVINKERDGALCDAMIVMAYNPQTREYKIMDAQAYYGEGMHNAERTKEMNTGVDFYASPTFAFNTLSHCYGCKLAGAHRYYIFDQSGDATVYGEDLKELSRTSVGGLIEAKVGEMTNNVNKVRQEAFDAKKNGKQTSQDLSDAGLDDGGDEMDDALKELEEVTGEKYDSGRTSDEKYEDISLNCLVKSAVMDGANVMYLTLMMYTGENPWIADIMLNRVVQIYSFDLSGNQIRFISRNESEERQENALKDVYLKSIDKTDPDRDYEQEATATLEAMKAGVAATSTAFTDEFTTFDSDIENFKASIAGYPDLAYNGGKGYRAIADSITNNGSDNNLALMSLSRWVVRDHAGHWYSNERVINRCIARYASSGYTDAELDKLLEYLDTAGVVRGMNGFDLFFFMKFLPAGDEGSYLFSNFYRSSNLNETIGDQGRVNRIEQVWKDMPDRMRNTMLQSLLGFYNKAASSYIKRTNIYKDLASFRRYMALSSVYYWLYGWDWERYFRYSNKTMTWEDYLRFLKVMELLPSMRGYDLNAHRNTTEIPAAEGTGAQQAFLLVHGTATDYSNMESVPHCGVIYLPKDTNAWVEPYEWNEEISVDVDFEIPNPNYVEPSDSTEDPQDPYIPDPVPGDERPVQGSQIPLENEVINPYTGSQSGSLSPSGVSTVYSSGVQSVGRPGEGGGTVSPLEQQSGEPKTIKERRKVVLCKEHTFPVSYRLCFPEGTTVQFVDMMNNEGSSNSSVRSGAVLFSDTAKQEDDGTLSYTANIVWQREQGVALKDSLIPGAAIDTGAFEYIDADRRRRMVIVMITEEGVKFYPSYKSGGEEILSNEGGHAYYMTNAELLTSTGFTPYTESGLQASVTTRLDSAELPADKYKDKNQVTVTQEQLALSLNSSRVGTIQAATSFTPISDSEVLISAYDSGLTMLRLNDTHDVLNLQSGSYYQSFPIGETGNYKIVGFDTEEYEYGSLDLARAKVYDFDVRNRRQEIYLTAIQNHLDQLAIDYVRRLNRTRVKIEQDAEGNITSQTPMVVKFEDDTSEEAFQESKLFGEDEGQAMAELKIIEQSAAITHSTQAENYLKKLRRRVMDQQAALAEVFELTKASKLEGIKEDPYWVGLKERLQATTELGDLKDILVEIVLSDEMIATLSEEDAATYEKFKENLNYQKEQEERNKALSEEGVSAQKLEELLETRKTAEDFKEDYDELNREKAAKGEEIPTDQPDELAATLNTDIITTKVETKEEVDDRANARALVLQDIENNYFEGHPLPAEKIYAPDGSYEEGVTAEREDEAWDEYLDDLLYRVNPNNLSAARAIAAEEFAELTYSAARTMSAGVMTDTQLTVSEETQEKMKNEVLDGMGNCETVLDVELLFFGTQAKNLGSPYNKYYAEITQVGEKTYESDAAKAKEVRASPWYVAMRGYLLTDPTVQTMLTSKGQTWEEYIQSVFSHKTGRVLRDEETGETAGGNTTAGTTYAQLVEFLCEGAGEVDQETKISMVEDLLIAMLSLSAADQVEEAVMIERMQLPAYKQYQDDYDAFSKQNFETNSIQGDVIAMSSGASLRRQALIESDFYQALIQTMKDSELVKSYLAEQNATWEQYMASLPALAQNENILDPAASAKKVYETFEPYVPISKEDRPGASDGSEEVPTYEDISKKIGPTYATTEEKTGSDAEGQATPQNGAGTQVKPQPDIEIVGPRIPGR